MLIHLPHPTSISISERENATEFGSENSLSYFKTKPSSGLAAAEISRGTCDLNKNEFCQKNVAKGNMKSFLRKTTRGVHAACTQF
jgi:hypothetical protein